MRYPAFFLLVVKRFFSRRNLSVLAVLAIILLYGIHKGGVERKSISADSNEFQETEELKFKMLLNYKEYANQGINVFFIPPAVGVFFSNPVMFSELSGNVNSIIKLDIKNNCKGRLVLSGNSTLRFRFSVLVLLFMSLAALFLGFEPMRHREFLKMLAAKWSPLKIHLSVVISRLILVGLILFVIFGFGILLVSIEGILLSTGDFIRLGFYLATTYVMLIFFFLIGTIIALLKKILNPAVFIFLTWIILVFLAPMIVDSIIEEKSFDIPSSYNLDNEKLQIVNDFEKRFIDERGGAKNYTLEESRKIIEDYWEKVFPKVEKVDEDLKAKIASKVDSYMNTAILIPTTFYNLTAHELSGRGYSSYFSFLGYNQDLRRRFLRFWLNRVYYNDRKVLKNFITGEENIFRSRSHIPPVLIKGLLINFSYIVVLGFFSFLLFIWYLHHMKAEEAAKLEKLAVKLKPGNLSVNLVKGNTLKNALFTVFSGKSRHLKRFKGKVLVDGTNIAEDKRKKEFAYICSAADLPGDIIVKDFLDFYRRWVCSQKQPREKKESPVVDPGLAAIIGKRIEQLEDHEKFQVSLELMQMSESPVYLINDVTSGLPLDYSIRFKEKIDELTQQGAIVVYLTAPHMLEVKAMKTGSCFEEGNAWVYLVEGKKVESKIRDTKAKSLNKKIEE